MLLQFNWKYDLKHCPFILRSWWVGGVRLRMILRSVAEIPRSEIPQNFDLYFAIYDIRCHIAGPLREVNIQTGTFPLQWRYNDPDGVSNYQPQDCLRKRLFRRRSKIKHHSSASLAFMWGIHRWPVYSPHKGPVTRKMFPFDDVTIQTGTFPFREASKLTQKAFNSLEESFL